MSSSLGTAKKKLANTYPDLNLHLITVLGTSKEEEEKEKKLAKERKIAKEPVTKGDGTDRDVVEVQV